MGVDFNDLLRILLLQHFYARLVLEQLVNLLLLHQVLAQILEEHGMLFLCKYLLWTFLVICGLRSCVLFQGIAFLVIVDLSVGSVLNNLLIWLWNLIWLQLCIHNRRLLLLGGVRGGSEGSHVAVSCTQEGRHLTIDDLLQLCRPHSGHCKLFLNLT